MNMMIAYIVSSFNQTYKWGGGDSQHFFSQFHNLNSPPIQNSRQIFGYDYSDTQYKLFMDTDRYSIALFWSKELTICKERVWDIKYPDINKKRTKNGK